MIELHQGGQITTINLKLKTALFFTALFLLLFGGYSFVRGVYVSADTVLPEKTLEKLPLGNLEGAAIDPSGNIYCISSFYSRINVYNQEGSFKYALKIPSNSGFFRVIWANHLLVYTFRNQMVYIFNSEGSLTFSGSAKNSPVYDNQELVDASGNRYIVNNNILYPHIAKLVPDGKVSIFISNSLGEWLLAGPFPAFLFFAVGLVTIFFLLGFPGELKIIFLSRTKSRPKGKGGN